MAVPLATLTDRVTALAFDSHVLEAGWLGTEPAFVLADGRVVIGRTHPPVRPHRDGILEAVREGARLVTGGDDGSVAAILGPERSEILHPANGSWIDALATGPDGSVAWSSGRKVTFRDGTGREKTLEAPSSARGLAFAPKGLRLAIAHIDGVTLWFPNLDGEPERLEWKGPHFRVTFSPDGRFVVSAMQENQLHGWRLADKGHMRMSGYPGKTRDFSWSADGLWLATSGAEAAIVWPFAKDGPTGKAPRECGIRPARVTKVAFHPKASVLAIGYADGWVLLVRFTDASELLVRAGGDGSPITALGWDRDGKRLAFGAESGSAGLLELPVG